MAGMVLHDDLSPSGDKLQHMIEQFKSDCFLAVERFHHPNVVRFFGLCDKSPCKFPMILQEYIC